MDVFLVTVQQVFILFSIVLIGFYTLRKGKIGDSAVDVLTYVYTNIMLPCAIFKAMHFDFTIEVLKECSLLIGISVVVIAIEVLGGYVFNAVTKQPRLDKNLYRYCILFSNIGMMGIPVIEGIFGSEGLFYMSVFIFVNRLMINSYGFLILQKDTPYETKLNMDMFKNKFILAMVCGIVVSVAGIKLPSAVEGLVDNMSKGCSTVGMLVVGMNLAEYKVLKMLKSGLAWTVSGIRLIFIPLCALVLLRIFDVDIFPAMVAVVTLGLPCPAYASILTKRYGGNYMRGSQIVIISTAMSALTIPLLVWICNVVYGVI